MLKTSCARCSSPLVPPVIDTHLIYLPVIMLDFQGPRYETCACQLIIIFQQPIQRKRARGRKRDRERRGMWSGRRHSSHVFLTTEANVAALVTAFYLKQCRMSERMSVSVKSVIVVKIARS